MPGRTTTAHRVPAGRRTPTTTRCRRGPRDTVGEPQTNAPGAAGCGTMSDRQTTAPDARSTAQGPPCPRPRRPSASPRSGRRPPWPCPRSRAWHRCPWAGIRCQRHPPCRCPRAARTGSPVRPDDHEAVVDDRRAVDLTAAGRPPGSVSRSSRWERAPRRPMASPSWRRCCPSCGSTRTRTLSMAPSRRPGRRHLARRRRSPRRWTPGRAGRRRRRSVPRSPPTAASPVRVDRGLRPPADSGRSPVPRQRQTRSGHGVTARAGDGGGQPAHGHRRRRAAGPPSGSFLTAARSFARDVTWGERVTVVVKKHAGGYHLEVGRCLPERASARLTVPVVPEASGCRRICDAGPPAAGARHPGDGALEDRERGGEDDRLGDRHRVGLGGQCDRSRIGDGGGLCRIGC